MDGETERKLSALILAEAQRLRQRAQSEGIHAYLRPGVRFRPNAQFLRATVQGVESANRAQQMSEMWEQRGREVVPAPAQAGARPQRREQRGAKGGAETRSARDEDASPRRPAPNEDWDSEGAGGEAARELAAGPARPPGGMLQKGLEAGCSAVLEDDRWMGACDARPSGAGAPRVGTLKGESQVEPRGNGADEMGRHQKRARALAPDGAHSSLKSMPASGRDKVAQGSNRASGAPAQAVAGGLSASDRPPDEVRGGVADAELRSFLLSRAKRGRGAVGSHMDAAGPFSAEQGRAGGQVPGPAAPLVGLLLERVREEWEERAGGDRGGGPGPSHEWGGGERVEDPRRSQWGPGTRETAGQGETSSSASSSSEEERRRTSRGSGSKVKRKDVKKKERKSKKRREKVEGDQGSKRRKEKKSRHSERERSQNKRKRAS